MDNERLLAVNGKKATKQPRKTKKKPVKVVYISNPMKVNTSASEFRALVQQLTGKDAADIPPQSPDSIKFCSSYSVDGGRDQELILPHAIMEVKEEEEHAPEDEVPSAVQGSSELASGSDLSFDDDFMPQMLENFPRFLPSNFCPCSGG